MDGQPTGTQAALVVDELRARLAAAPSGRLLDAVRLIMNHAFAVLAEFKPTEAEFDTLVQFLTEVGYATDARRQELVLLADVLGLSASVADSLPVQPGATPATLPGPFYRADAPQLQEGANLSRDGAGEALSVTGIVKDCNGQPVRGAMVEVWHANGQGRYENQDPDNQPEHNLRGRLTTDHGGRFTFLTVHPAGYSLPSDGPVGLLARRLGLSLDRPAHIHFAVSATGFRRLVTAVFDGNDPAIGRDPLFAVKPSLVATFPASGNGQSLNVSLVIAAEADPAPHPTHDRGKD